MFSLTICGCIKSSSSGKEKELKDTLSGLTYANDSLKRQILYHGDCSFSLSETNGWLANPEPPQMSDLVKILVMYEPNSSIKHSAPIGIYSNVIFKEHYKDLTLNGFLKGEKERALNDGEKVIDAKSIGTQDDKIAIIRKYFNDNIGEYFAIAYVDEPKYIIMVTYTAKDINDFNNYYAAFEDIVQSYQYLGVTVIDETIK